MGTSTDIAAGSAAWLSLGSNLGDRTETLAAAVRHLGDTPGIEVRRTSSLYDTDPWGGVEQAPFLNVAVEVRTHLAPLALLDTAKRIERELGRTPGPRWGPRAIDIDIVHMAGIALHDDRLTLPHPHWRERAFVLVPLVEIAPDLSIEGLRVADALAVLGGAGVRRLGPVPTV